MKKFQYSYMAAVFGAAMLALSGCSSQTNATTAAQTEQETVQETETAEAEESTAGIAEAESVPEAVPETEESMGDSLPAPQDLVRIYGPVSKAEEDGSFLIDNQSGISYDGEIILNLADFTKILDAATGLPVNAQQLEDGSEANVYIGEAMTKSIPPQTNAWFVIVNVPEDMEVPEYVEVESVLTNADNSETVLTASDGTSYTFAEIYEISAYKTKNIVTLDELTPGRKCMVWADSDDMVSRIIVFEE